MKKARRRGTSGLVTDGIEIDIAIGRRAGFRRDFEWIYEYMGLIGALPKFAMGVLLYLYFSEDVKGFIMGNNI